eukprot:8723292-Pyramimonas_sp.AAC.1
MKQFNLPRSRPNPVAALTVLFHAFCSSRALLSSMGPAAWASRGPPASMGSHRRLEHPTADPSGLRLPQRSRRRN